jgi:hypothetical protein
MVTGFVAGVMSRGGLWGRVVDRYVSLMLGIPAG